MVSRFISSSWNPRLRPSWRGRHLVYQVARSPRDLKGRRLKIQPKLSGNRQAGAQVKLQKKGKIANETTKLTCLSAADLASLLQGEEGFFLCQNRGQNYVTVAKAGHSIAFGPTPIGRVIQEQPTANLGPEPWVVTKISNSTEFNEFRGTNGAR